MNAFVCLDLTGPDVRKHKILQVGFCLYNERMDELLSSFSSYVKFGEAADLDLSYLVESGIANSEDKVTELAARRNKLWPESEAVYGSLSRILQRNEGPKTCIVYSPLEGHVSQRKSNERTF